MLLPDLVAAFLRCAICSAIFVANRLYENNWRVIGTIPEILLELTMPSSDSRTVEFKDLDPILDQMRGAVQDAFRNGTAIDQVESEVFGHLLRLGRSLLQSLFDAMQHGDVGPTMDIHGKDIRRLPEMTNRPYCSIFGQFELERYSYGTRQSQVHLAVPFDEHLGLPKTGFSLLLESWVGQLSTSESYEEACSKLERILKIKVYVDSAQGMVERLGKTATSVLDSQPPIDVASEAEVLVQTSDNKGIVMRNEYPKPVPEPVGAPVKTRGPKPDTKRMACMAGIYTIDRNPRTPQQILDLLFHIESNPPLEGTPPRPANPRYFARLTMLDAQGKQIGLSAEEQAQQWLTANAMRRRVLGQTLIVMHDGQTSLWERDSDYQEGWDTIKILDLLHLIPRIWTSAKILQPESIEKFVKENLLTILMGGIGIVIMGLRRKVTNGKLTSANKKKMKTVLGFLEANKSRMNYGEYLSKGLPIATGFIEGACRHVIKDRLERTGMRWTRKGAQSMLNLRCIESSKIWESLMDEHRKVSLHYEDGRRNYFENLPAATAA